MLDQERKRLEREIYNREANMERPQYHSYWDAELYGRLHAFEFDENVDELGRRYLSGRKVLVVGAGRNEVRFALRFSDQVHALNISERIVAELQALFPQVHSFVGDAEQLVDVTERYDVVLCKSILHHLHPIDMVLASIRQLLTRGGHLFIVAEPGLLNPFAAAARYFIPSQQHTPGERPFVFSQFSKVLSANYVAENERYFFILAMLWPYAAQKLPAFKPLANTLLGWTLRAERQLFRLPRMYELAWVTTGVYRAR